MRNQVNIKWSGLMITIFLFWLCGAYAGHVIGVRHGYDKAIKCLEAEAVAESTVETETLTLNPGGSLTVPNEEYPVLTAPQIPSITIYPIHYNYSDGSLWIYYDGEWEQLPERVIYVPGGES